MIVITTRKQKNKSEEVKRNCFRSLQIGGSRMSLEGVTSELTHPG